MRGAAVFALEKLGASDDIEPAAGAAIRPRRAYARAFAAERVALAQLEGTLYPETRTPR
ncbi:MAG: hypothetical protein H0U85_02125 [Gemmatimonadales bacterium]|nr:hypothetical protein [Gemmatimonadales bacterium]